MAVARGVRQDQPAGLSRVATCTAWAGIIAGICDVFENIGLLTMLWANPFNPVPFVTSLFATVKFFLVAWAVFVFLGVLVWPTGKNRRCRPSFR